MLARNRQNKTVNQSQRSFSWFWYVISFILLVWIALLWYFHTMSLNPVDHAIPPTMAVVQNPINDTSSKASVTVQKTLLRSESVVVKRDEGRMHIVFSTDCSFFQDWQTLLVFHSAMVIKQEGSVTRIASGCTEEKQAELKVLYQKLFPQYHVHFTPDFKRDGKTNKKYDFYNKPYGIHHWLQYANPAIEPGVVVIVLDPDMIILRKFKLDISNDPANLFLPGFDPFKEKVPSIGKGQPVAQLYGLGAPWAMERNGNFNRTYICGAGSPCLKVSRKFGEDHFSVGPPYMLEKDDLLRLTTSWTEFVPKVYEHYPALLAEMYAYSMAAAHQDLPHFTMLSLMVSNIDMNEEGWQHVDALKEDVCQPAVDGVYYPGKPMPTVLHFCQFYRIGEYGFQKRRIRKGIFDCNSPMMAEPPLDVAKLRYKNRDGEIVKLGPQQSKRGSFMLCTIHRSINAMLTYYKSKMCSLESVNTTKAVNVVDKQYWS